jgi:quercetin 2,3-dioxygenase
MSTAKPIRETVVVRRAEDRNQTRLAWLHGRHSFDTGVVALGQDTHHGVLVVNNHDTIAPRSGFDMHPHRNMEIVTWVLAGALVHEDSEGHSGLIYPNLAQGMTAGTGIWHSERNGSPAAPPLGEEPVDLVQMWVVPDELEVTPGYMQLELESSDLDNRLAVVASGIARYRNEAAIKIHNRSAALHVARLDPGRRVEVPDAPFVHVYVARGTLELEESGLLYAGDAGRLTSAGGRSLEAVEPAEVLIWEMHSSLHEDA